MHFDAMVVTEVAATREINFSNPPRDASLMRYLFIDGWYVIHAAGGGAAATMKLQLVGARLPSPVSGGRTR